MDNSVVFVFFLPEVEHNWPAYFHTRAIDAIGATCEARQNIAALFVSRSGRRYSQRT
jgi:hypothetical protein